jgi:outer membrane cobalamin receptor
LALVDKKKTAAAPFRYKRLKSVCAGVLLVAFVAAGHAGAQPQRDKTRSGPDSVAARDSVDSGSCDSTRAIMRLNDITVIEQSVVDELRNSPEAVSVIDASELRGRSISIEDALSRVAGITVRRSGGMGGDSRIMIHGLEGKRVKVFVDGSPINAPDGTFSLNDFPLDLVERIEVYKGLVPARFGGDGIGGAINIVERDYDPSYIDIIYSYSSFNTHQAFALFKKNNKKLGWQTGLESILYYSDNDFTFEHPKIEDLTVTCENGRYTWFGVTAPQTFTKLWFDEITLEPVFITGTRDIQGFKTNYKHVTSEYWSALLEFAFEKERFFSERLSFQYDGLLWPLGETRFIDTSHYQYDFEGNSWPSSIGEGQGEEGLGPNNSNDKLFEFRQRLNLTLSANDNHDINLNSNFHYTKNTFADSLAYAHAGFNTSPYPGRLLSVVTGLTWEANSKNRTWTNIVSGKAFYYRTSLIDMGENVMGGLLEDPETKKHNQVTFGFGEAVRWAPVAPLGIKASFQRTYRIPTPDEFFGDGNMVSPSPELKPEKANNVNIGLYFDKSDVLLMKRVRLDATGFYRFVEDMIRKFESVNGAGYYNSPKIKIRGFDAELKVDVTKWLYGYGNVTYQDVRNALKYEPGTDNAPNHLYGKREPHFPFFFFNLGLEVHTANLFGLFGDRQYSKLTWDAQFVDEYLFNYEESVKQNMRIPARFVQHAGVQQSFADDLFSISAEIRNMFDVEEVDLYENPIPGRTFALKAHFALIGKEE